MGRSSGPKMLRARKLSKKTAVARNRAGRTGAKGGAVCGAEWFMNVP